MKIVVHGPVFVLSALANEEFHKRAEEERQRLFHVVIQGRDVSPLWMMALHWVRHFHIDEWIRERLGVTSEDRLRIDLHFSRVDGTEDGWKEVCWVITAEASDIVISLEDIALTRAGRWSWRNWVGLDAWLGEQRHISSSPDERILRLQDPWAKGFFLDALGVIVLEQQPDIKQALLDAPDQAFESR